MELVITNRIVESEPESGAESFYICSGVRVVKIEIVGVRKNFSNSPTLITIVYVLAYVVWQCTVFFYKHNGLLLFLIFNRKKFFLTI